MSTSAYTALARMKALANQPNQSNGSLELLDLMLDACEHLAAALADGQMQEEDHYSERSRAAAGLAFVARHAPSLRDQVEEAKTLIDLADAEQAGQWRLDNMPMEHPTVPGYDIDDPKAIRLAMLAETGRW